MNFKNILIIFLLSWFFFYYTMVDSAFFKNVDIVFSGLSSKNIYLNSDKLNKNIIVFKSVDDISNYKISSICSTHTEFLYKKESLNFFSFSVLDKKCFNENFYLQNEKWDIFTNTHFKLNLISDFELYNKFTDIETKMLALLSSKYITEKNKFKLFASIDNTNPNFEYIKKSRHYDELEYNNSKINYIIEKRKKLYQIPISWYKLPDGKNPSKLPNSSRPYRASYTNAIHEWWDIDAPAGTKIVSIDDGIIVKIVKDFKFWDLSKMKKWDQITQKDKIMNLDILRWNQVWVKTMKWDVIFYSHLDKVNPDLQVWDTINRGQYIGTVWITWVPDKNYTDYHLHFELRKNPYKKENAWNNTLEDYMNWDWYFKWETKEYILQNQYKIFQK